MTLAQLKASRAIWAQREAFRRRMWHWYKDRSKRANKAELAAKWLKSLEEAKAAREHRDAQIAKLAPKLNETVAFDGTPTFRGLALMLADCRANGWGGTLQSSDRRQGVAERYGKSSQAALYAGWIAHRAGFNPANPPGRSSHELRSDGVAYRGPMGRPLAWFQLGLDVSDAAGLLTAMAKLGYRARRPYPSGSEEHHVNMVVDPTANLKKRGKA